MGTGGGGSIRVSTISHLGCAPVHKKCAARSDSVLEYSGR